MTKKNCFSLYLQVQITRGRGGSGSLRSVRKEANGNSLFRYWHRTKHYLLFCNKFIKLEPFHQIVHENKHFQASKPLSRAHHGSSTKWNKCVRSWSGPFKSGRIESFGFWEVFWISMRRVCIPIHLHGCPQRKLLVNDYDC